ncbi:MAG: DNA polymerase IV [Ignavibacteriales bacterium]|nr:DNA polymerase IV [Ignavibacteriales bacterium]
MSLVIRSIAHLDLDCFYVSVERIKDPSLVGRPVVVGGTPTGRGVVASASYEARAFGVRSAMPTAAALRLCPHLTIVRGRFGDYTHYSNKLYERILELAPVVERASIDEMYFDLTGCESLYHNDLPGFIKSLQHIVWKEFQLPCTISLASNKVVAKISAQTVKPAGVIYVPHGTEREFLAPLPIDAIPGVGKKTGEILRKKGFATVADIQKTSQDKLQRILGNHGLWIHDVANGLGPDELSTEHERKSIGNEETFARDISDRNELKKIIFSLTEEVCSSLRYRHLKARTFTLKLRYADFDTITRATTIEPADDDTIVFKTICELFEVSYARRIGIRLLGVRASHLVDEKQLELSLFPETGKRAQMLDAVDKLRKKFGDDVIHVGGH